MKYYILLAISALLFLSCMTSEYDTSGLYDMKEEKSDFDWVLVWEDDFDTGLLDIDKWNFIEGAGGYGNNEWQYYTSRSENARIENNALVLEARKENFQGSPYTSAKLTTSGKAEWTYGRYEIRAKLPEGQGIWPAIWMMPSDMNVYGGWPSCGEIDIMELVGHEPDTIHGTLHYGNPWKYTGGSFELEEGSFQDDYHEFALEWLPGEMRWYVDDQLYLIQKDWYSQENTMEEKFTFNAPYDRDFYLQLNVAVGGNWPGYPDETTEFPQKMIIDWIRVYESAEGYEDPPIKDAEVEKIITGRAPQDNGNYIYNETFDLNMDYWDFGNYEGGSGTASIEEGEMKISISDSGNQIWANQLVQLDMFIEQGKTYNVSFSARAQTPRKIMIKIGGLGDRGWAAYSNEEYIQINENMENYSFDFTMEEKTDDKARYEFNMGLGNEDIWLDDISLTLVKDLKMDKGVAVLPARKALGDGNLIYNGKFDQGRNRTAFWNLDYDSESDAFLSVSTDIYERSGHLSILSSSKLVKGIILYQDQISISENEAYTLVFDAYARGNRTLSTAILNEDGDILYGPLDVELNTENQTYSVVFPVDGNFRNVKVAFLPADSGVKRDPDIILDNVSFRKAD